MYEYKVFFNSANSIDHFYIDGTDVALEGTFRLSETGSLLPYTNWNSGEPNNWHGVEHCINMWGYTGLWNDLPCYAVVPSVCEIEGKRAYVWACFCVCVIGFLFRFGVSMRAPAGYIVDLFEIVHRIYGILSNTYQACLVFWCVCLLFVIDCKMRKSAFWPSAQQFFFVVRNVWSNLQYQSLVTNFDDVD